MEESSLQPWHLFTFFFLAFQAVVIYLRHILLTTIAAVAFGAVTEVTSRYLFVWGRSDGKVSSIIIEGQKSVEEKEEVSSDEELEEAYANIEVNFDESETEEEEEELLASAGNNGGKKETGKYFGQTSLDFQNRNEEDDFANEDQSKGLSLQIAEESDFTNSMDVPELEMFSPDILDEEEDDYEPHPTLQEVTVSQGKSFLLDFEPLLIAGEKEEGASKVEPEEIDIDLTDPAVEAAATKIQSVFKGFRARKNLQQKSLQL